MMYVSGYDAMRVDLADTAVCSAGPCYPPPCIVFFSARGRVWRACEESAWRCQKYRKAAICPPLFGRALFLRGRSKSFGRMCVVVMTCMKARLLFASQGGSAVVDRRIMQKGRLLFLFCICRHRRRPCHGGDGSQRRRLARKTLFLQQE